MCLIAVLVLSALSAAASAHAGWLKDLSQGRSLDLGYGFSVRVDDRGNATTPLDRHALRLDYADYGISVAKARNSDALEVDLYMREREEGRKKKVGEALLPAIFGFKAMGVIAMTLTAMGALVLKALAVAKLAVIVSSGLLISKYLHHKEPSYVEFDHQGSETHPMYAEYPTATGYSLGTSDPSNYLSYAYGLSGGDAGAASEAVGHYTILAQDANGTATIAAATPLIQRQDATRRKSVPIVPVLTVKKFTIRD